MFMVYNIQKTLVDRSMCMYGVRALHRYGTTKIFPLVLNLDAFKYAVFTQTLVRPLLSWILVIR